MSASHRYSPRLGGVTVAIAVLIAAVAGGAATRASAQFVSPGCFVTAGGTINGDSFGGRAASRRDGGIEGRWTHATREGLTFTGTVDRLGCTPNGSDPGHPEVTVSVADMTGSGVFDGEDVTFTVHVEDDGEPGGQLEVYRINIFDSQGALIYTTSGTRDTGNIQIHSTNRGHP